MLLVPVPDPEGGGGGEAAGLPKEFFGPLGLSLV